MTEDFHEDPDEADNSPADELVPIFRKVLAAGLILALLIAIALLILRRIERAQREPAIPSGKSKAGGSEPVCRAV